MTTFGQARQVLGFVWRHPANRGRRLRGVVRAISFQVRGRLGRPTLTVVGQRARMRVWLHDNAAAKALYANPPDWNEMRAWRRLLRHGDLFVDVGSNVGSYALWAADTGAEVIAVEPSRATAEKLRANIALNDLPIAVQQCALADKPGQMWLTSDRGPTNHLLPHQSPPAEPARMEPARMEPVPMEPVPMEPVPMEPVPMERVEVDTLDNILGTRHAAGVKIDVEGAERLVLEGARRALSEHRISVLQIEWNGMSELVLGETRAAVAEILAEYGYTLARPDHDGILRQTEALPVSEHDIFAIAPGMGQQSPRHLVERPA